MLTTCSSCRKPIRVTAESLLGSTHCPSCGLHLPAVSTPIEADPGLFEEVADQARVPVLVGFWAPWCAPCRRVAPEIQRAAQQTAGRALVLRVDADRYPDLAAEFFVADIPNLVVLKRGRVIRQRTGIAPSAAIVSWLEEAAG